MGGQRGEEAAEEGRGRCERALWWQNMLGACSSGHGGPGQVRDGSEPHSSSLLPPPGNRCSEPAEPCRAQWGEGGKKPLPLSSQWGPTEVSLWSGCGPGDEAPQAGKWGQLGPPDAGAWFFCLADLPWGLSFVGGLGHLPTPEPSLALAGRAHSSSVRESVACPAELPAAGKPVEGLPCGWGWPTCARTQMCVLCRGLRA